MFFNNLKQIHSFTRRWIESLAFAMDYDPLEEVQNELSQLRREVMHLRENKQQN